MAICLLSAVHPFNPFKGGTSKSLLDASVESTEDQILENSINVFIDLISRGGADRFDIFLI
jgi:hypothetical protein